MKFYTFLLVLSLTSGMSQILMGMNQPLSVMPEAACIICRNKGQCIKTDYNKRPIPLCKTCYAQKIYTETPLETKLRHIVGTCSLCLHKKNDCINVSSRHYLFFVCMSCVVNNLFRQKPQQDTVYQSFCIYCSKHSSALTKVQQEDNLWYYYCAECAHYNPCCYFCKKISHSLPYETAYHDGDQDRPYYYCEDCFNRVPWSDV